MAIRKASRHYNSDYMSRICDEQLEQLEDRLTALYAETKVEVLKEYSAFIEKYQDDYLEMTAKLDAGEITQAEFTRWTNNRILKDTLYKETVKSLTDILVNSDIAAMSLISDELPYIIAESYNFVQSLGWAAADEAGLSVGTFQIYNAETVQAILKKNPDLLPVVDIPEDQKWNKTKINNEITHGIIKGESIPKIANRLQAVTNMDENAATRNARTAMTGAENLGRNESFHNLKKKGIPVRMQWSATYDDRTRETHLMLDGTFQNEDGYFGLGILVTPIEYPGDPAGDPEEIYNCRCRASIKIEGIDHSQDENLYAKFMTQNYPEEYEYQKAKDKEKGRTEAREKAKQRKEDLRKQYNTLYDSLKKAGID